MKSEILISWNSYLDLIPDSMKDVYFSEEYVRLYENNVSSARCFLCKDDNRILLIPVLVRQVGEYFDFESAYGYGGPISNTDDDIWNINALNCIENYIRNNSFLCGFIRFHPLLRNERVHSNSTAVIFDRKTVTINTSFSEDKIWSDEISSKNRNMIRKAEKNGLKFIADYDFRYIDQFIILYNSTMKRLAADEFYFFDRKYYDELRYKLNGHSFLGTVWKDGKMICGAIFMYSGYYGHYHLEGSDKIYSSLGANNMLLWKASCEMHKMGVRQFHLGGGYDTTPDNSLLKFKKSFSKSLSDFYIGKTIINHTAYNKICREWENENPEKIRLYGNRVLKYRY